LKSTIEEEPRVLFVKHGSLGFGGKEEVSKCNASFKSFVQVKTTKITFVKARGTKEKTTKKRVDNKPLLQHACGSLNEGNQGMFLPSKTPSTLGGANKKPTNTRTNQIHVTKHLLFVFVVKIKVIRSIIVDTPMHVPFVVERSSSDYLQKESSLK